MEPYVASVVRNATTGLYLVQLVFAEAKRTVVAFSSPEKLECDGVARFLNGDYAKTIISASGGMDTLVMPKLTAPQTDAIVWVLHKGGGDDGRIVFGVKSVTRRSLIRRGLLMSAGMGGARLTKLGRVLAQRATERAAR